MATSSRIRRLLANPARIPPAVIRRLVPNHPTRGFEWVHRPDGSVTFRERGFVAANSPSLLLARHNYEASRIRSLLGQHRFERSLEIGCGYGRLTTVFAEYSDQHHAVDINDEALIMARRTYPRFDFTRASALELPFPKGHFDLVTTWTVLQHIPPSQIEVATAELLRVLRPGGVLLMCEETRYPDSAGSRAHTWHRTVDQYQEFLDPLKLEHSEEFPEIDRLPESESPGRVMFWTR